MSLIQTLRYSKIDVIGDVHGEKDALLALLDRLGYDDGGRHKDARHLVFVGDLTDRGPDSPGVVHLVQRLVESGQGQAVAGNHELNIMRGERKHGNHWFFGHSYDPQHEEYGACAALPPDGQNGILDFFRSLPVALESQGMRVVHAAWIDSAIERCRPLDVSVDEAFRMFDDEVRRSSEYSEVKGRHDEDMVRLGPRALDEDSPQPDSEHIGPYEEYCQVRNPIRVITSGLEQARAVPFQAAGKWRFVDRVQWWREYPSSVPVLFGHYWRWWDPAAHQFLSKGETYPFPDDEIGPNMADDDNAFCVDFSAGSRFKQRFLGHAEPYHGRLAAVRWPEKCLVFDGGDPAPFAQ